MKTISRTKGGKGSGGLKRLALLLLTAALILGLCACVQDDNSPYVPDKPAPAAHDGTFVSEHGTMRFNGDGKSVVICFDSFLAGLTALPEGEQAASYDFLSGDLPPHGSVSVRYDTAHELKLTVGEKSVVLKLGVPSADGKSFQVGVDTVTPERIPLVFTGEEGKISVIFEKKERN